MTIFPFCKASISLAWLEGGSIVIGWHEPENLQQFWENNSFFLIIVGALWFWLYDNEWIYTDLYEFNSGISGSTKKSVALVLLRMMLSVLKKNEKIRQKKKMKIEKRKEDVSVDIVSSYVND